MTINSPMKLMKHFNKIAKMDRSKAYVNMQKAYTNGKVEAGLFSTSSSMKKTDKKIEKSNIFLDKNMVEAERGDGEVTHRDIFYHSNFIVGARLFGTWRNTASVYRLDENIAKQALSATIPDETPSEIFENLPEWSVYMEMPEFSDIQRRYLVLNEDGSTKEQYKRVIGFWAMHDTVKVHVNQENKKGYYLDLLFNFEHDDDVAIENLQLAPIRLFIHPDMTIAGSLSGLYASIGSGWEASVGLNDIKTVLSMLLWLCVEEPDITNIQDVMLSREDIRKPRYVKSKITGAFVVPLEETYFDIAKRMGGEVREWNKEIEHAKNNCLPKRKIPHIRRGHWNGVWTGSGDNKTYKTYWQKPIFVNGK